MKYLNDTIQVFKYMDKQIELEHELHEKLTQYTSLLLSVLFNYVDNNTINATLLLKVYNLFYKTNIKAIEKVIFDSIYKQVKLAENVVNTNNAQIMPTIKMLFTDSIIRVNRLFQGILNRILLIVPIGYYGLGRNIFTDETNKTNIIHRNSIALDKFVQSTVTQSIVTAIINNAKFNGYTEYIANNQHDDKVRPLHKEYFNGKRWIRFDNPPPCGEVGSEINCRCYILEIR